jgi:ribosomal protein L9
MLNIKIYKNNFFYFFLIKKNKRMNYTTFRLELNDIVKEQTAEDKKNQLEYANKYMKELNKRMNFIKKADDTVKANLNQIYEEKKNNGTIEDDIQKVIEE